MIATPVNAFKHSHHSSRSWRGAALIENGTKRSEGPLYGSEKSLG
jgi:hypothetical protein